MPGSIDYRDLLKRYMSAVYNDDRVIGIRCAVGSNAPEVNYAEAEALAAILHEVEAAEGYPIEGASEGSPRPTQAVPMERK